jgi:uncharacterized repeat protein (TIGR01451 family)
MTRARLLTTAGILHLTVATLLSMVFLFGRPVTVAGSGLGFTPTYTPTATPPSTTPEPPPPSPRLTITKTADPTEVLPGDLVTFVIQVCNAGDATAENVIVSDALPAELEVMSASASQGPAIVVGNGVRAEFGDLLPGTCAELTIVARVRADVSPCSEIGNVATIGDLVSNWVGVTIPCPPPLLPESGRMVAQAVVVGLLAVGAGLLTAGLVLGARKRV